MGFKKVNVSKNRLYNMKLIKLETLKKVNAQKYINIL